MNSTTYSTTTPTSAPNPNPISTLFKAPSWAFSPVHPQVEAEFAGMSADLALRAGDYLAHDYLAAKAAALRLRPDKGRELDRESRLEWPKIQGI